MLTLAAADTLAAGASVASQVTSTVFGMELSAAGVEVYKTLDQRQLAASPQTIYTTPASTTAFVKTITVVNCDVSARTAQFFRGGTASANAITQPVVIPAGGMAVYEDGSGWDVYDAAGQLQTVSYTVTGGVPVGGIIMWSGTIATIPTTWALCDGASNAPGPDLRDKFVVGAKQDDAGVAKSNILGSLSQSGGATGHSHSGHGNLSHAGGAVGDHTDLTHGLSVANHPDLTHAAIGDHASFALAHADHASGVVISVPSQAIASGADISIASHSVSVPSQAIASGADISIASHTVSVPSQAIASGADISIASHTVSVPSQAIPSGADISIASFTMAQASTAGLNSFASSNNRSGLTARAAYTHTIPATTGNRPTLAVSSVAGTASAITGSRPTLAVASVAGSVDAITGSRPTLAVASVAGSAAAITGSRPTLAVAAVSGSMPALSHADHSVATLSHGGVGTHAATDYGVHSFTAPPAHGTAGTVTHSFTQPSDHSLSAHDTVSMVPSFFALAFIQRMS